MPYVETVAKLTDQVIRQTKPRKDGQFEVRCEHRRGLRLAVLPSGRKRLFMRYTPKGNGGVTKTLHLAEYTQGGDALARAIKRWGEAKELIEAGKDPKTAGDAVGDPTASVAAYVARYLEVEVSAMRPGTQINVRPALGRLCAAYGSRRIETVRKSVYQRLIDDAAKRGPHAMHKEHQVYHAFLAWCSTKLDDFVNPLTSTSRGLPKVESRDRVLDDDELAELLRSTSHPFVWLLAATGARRCEISDLAWSEVRADRLVIDASRTKQSKTHEIPITAVIRRVLDTLPKRRKFVCNGIDIPLSGFSKLKDKMPDLSRPWTWHDLRRTFSTRLAQLGVRQEIIDACTGHSAGTIAQTYNRHRYEQERSAAFELWSKHLMKLVG